MTEENPDNNKNRPIEPEILPPDEEFQRTSAGRGSPRFEPVFAYSSFDSRGCAAPTITLILFFILLGQYGLLAALGFGVFYTCGAILGTLRMTRSLVLGQPLNPWLWRTGNWLVSFFLTVWLAGGFAQ